MECVGTKWSVSKQKPGGLLVAPREWGRCCVPTTLGAAADTRPLGSGSRPAPTSHHWSRPWSSPPLWRAQCSCHCKTHIEQEGIVDAQNHWLGMNFLSVNFSAKPVAGFLLCARAVIFFVNIIETNNINPITWKFKCNVLLKPHYDMLICARSAVLSTIDGSITC